MDVIYEAGRFHNTKGGHRKVDVTNHAAWLHKKTGGYKMPFAMDVIRTTEMLEKPGTMVVMNSITISQSWPKKSLGAPAMDVTNHTSFEVQPCSAATTAVQNTDNAF